MADLYIRWRNANTKDIGDRPITPCWPPNAVWTNESIWMSYPPNHPDPAKRNATAYEARVGEEVFINVQVYTRGARFEFPSLEAATPIVCQVWACTGANGVGPISALASSGGATGLEGLVLGVVDTPDFYGTASVLWTPAAADGLAFDTDGAAHVCLAANLVYNRPPGASPPGQGQRLPQFVSGGQQVRTIFPCGDGPTDPRSGVPIGHFQGQKNIRVLDPAATSMATIDVRALDGQGGNHILELRERVGRAAIDAAIREHLLAHPIVDVLGGRPRRQRSRKITPRLLEILAPELGEEVLASGSLPLEPMERGRLARGGRLVLAGKEDIRLQPARRPLRDVAIEGPAGVRGQVIEILTDPDVPGRVIVDLSAAQADAPGTVRVFDLAERGREGRLVGGTTFVTVALPEAHTPKKGR
jgi:hypothetical protein